MRSACRPLALMITVVGMAALTACGSAGGEYCATLTDNSEVSATAFTPVIPGMNDQEEVQERLDLLAEVEDSVPEEISEDVTTWQAYLEEVDPLISSSDPEDTTALIDAGTDEVDAAGSALSEHYTGTCMD